MQPKADVLKLYTQALAAAVAVEPVLLRAKRAECPNTSAALRRVDQCSDADPAQDDMEFRAAIARACTSFDEALHKFGAFLFKSTKATVAPSKDHEVRDSMCVASASDCVDPTGVAVRDHRSCESQKMEHTVDEYQAEEPALEVFDEREETIEPNDEEFMRLQTELEAIAVQASAFSSQIDEWKEQNGTNREALKRLEDRMTHRLRRARVRNIKFSMRIDEEWLNDEDRHVMRTLPCIGCVEERIANPPSDQEETGDETTAQANKKPKKKKKTIVVRK